jgi:class 3 adenylate cyclase
VKIYHQPLASEDVEYLVDRLRRVVTLINAGEHHMAVAKLLADIAALSSVNTKLTAEVNDDVR